MNLSWTAAVLDASMDAVITVDRVGRIQSWNSSAEQMFGYAAAAVLGRELGATIVPDHLRSLHRTGLARFASGEPAHILGGRTETIGQREDGTLFPVELTITRVDDGESVLFVGYLRDISERQRLVADLVDSRTRLISISDETRRRLERDLHDGAQQQLVGLAIALAAAKRANEQHAVDAGRLLEHCEGILTSAIAELRELARGVHNSVLTDRGLPAAVAQLARRSPIDVRSCVDLDHRLDGLVETSIYYLVAEGLTNATKYGARQVRIDITAGAGTTATTVVGAVTDDGPGGADPAKGTGLAGMSERLRAMGGTVEIDSKPGKGTRLGFAIPTRARRLVAV